MGSPRKSSAGNTSSTGRGANEATAAGGWSGPALVQSHAWRAMVLGRDSIVVAPTGSGKTLAYLVPGLLRSSLDSIQVRLSLCPSMSTPIVLLHTDGTPC